MWNNRIETAYYKSFFHKPESQPAFFFYDLIKIFSAGICFAWLFHIILSLIASWFHMSYSMKSFLPMLQQQDFIAFFLLVTIIWPVIEETVFRLWMRPKYLYLWISIATIIAYMIGWVYELILRQTLTIWGWIIFLWIITSKYIKYNDHRAERFMARHWMKIYILQSLLFGLLHISNYQVLQPIWLGILMVVPQIVLGTMLGFERVYWWRGSNVLHHIFHNFFLFSPFILFYFAWYNMEMLLGKEWLSWAAGTAFPLWLQISLIVYLLLYIAVIVIGWKTLIRFTKIVFAWKQSLSN